MNILEYPRLIRPLISVFLCIASIFLSLAGRPTIPHGRELDMSKFELTWSDEFDGDKLDLTKWDGHYYSDGDTIIRRGSYWNNSLATVSDGSLHIATKYYPDGLNGNGKPGWYTSGMTRAAAMSSSTATLSAAASCPRVRACGRRFGCSAAALASSTMTASWVQR